MLLEMFNSLHHLEKTRNQKGFGTSQKQHRKQDNNEARPLRP